MWPRGVALCLAAKLEYTNKRQQNCALCHTRTGNRQKVSCNIHNMTHKIPHNMLHRELEREGETEISNEQGMQQSVYLIMLQLDTPR